MTQFLFKHHGDLLPRVGEIAKVGYKEKMKVVERMNVRGIGDLNIMGGSGKFDHGMLEVIAAKAGVYNVEATREGVRSKIRRLRPDEAAQLASIENEIAVQEAVLAELKSARREILKAAWAKGHAVTVKELVERIPV
jgi:hypothetical protein